MQARITRSAPEDNGDLNLEVVLEDESKTPPATLISQPFHFPAGTTKQEARAQILRRFRTLIEDRTEGNKLATDLSQGTTFQV